jgi:hypothetical protein
MTAQVDERIIIDGQEMPMACCPPLPVGHARLYEVDDERVLRDEPWLFSTACWRRYMGTWEIRDERLYLVKVVGRYRLAKGGPLFADWVSGVLRVPRGKQIRYVHMGFESVYEEDTFIEVEGGVVAGTRVVDNRDSAGA